MPDVRFKFAGIMRFNLQPKIATLNQQIELNFIQIDFLWLFLPSTLCNISQTHLSQSIESSEEFVEDFHEILGAVSRRDGRKSDNIGIQYAVHDTEDIKNRF